MGNSVLDLALNRPSLKSKNQGCLLEASYYEPNRSSHLIFLQIHKLNVDNTLVDNMIQSYKGQ